MLKNQFLRYKTINEKAMVNLFCFPFAGGAASYYLKWDAGLPPHINLFSIQLPGRETRFSEPFIEDFPSLIPQLVESIKPKLDKPFIFYGHSMGGMLAYVTALSLQEEYNISPLFSMFSGSRAPDKYYDLLLSRLPDEELIEELKKTGGFPDELLADRVSCEIFLKIIRSDLTLLESISTIKHTGPVDFPLHILHSDNDSLVQENHLTWDLFSSAQVQYRKFEGNHFFINEYQDQILTLLSEKLEKHID